MDLQQIKEAASARYTPFPVKINAKTTIELRPPTALAREQREEAVALLESVSPTETEADAVKRIRRVLTLLAGSQAKANAIVKAVDSDVILLVEIVRQWSDHVRAGGASPSLS